MMPSQELLDAWRSGSLSQSDITLQFLIDGMQLWSGLQSEAWVFIWVVHNLPLSMQYKKNFAIPGAILPGPNKPGDIDSFLTPHYVMLWLCSTKALSQLLYFLAFISYLLHHAIIGYLT